MKKIINSKNAPTATGPFNQAILTKANYNLELSWQIWLDPATWTLVEWWIEQETEQTLRNIKAVLNQIWWDFDNIIKSRIYLTNMNDYIIVNQIYWKYFSENSPSRIALAVKELPLGALIEIECVAAGDEINEKE